MSSIATVRISSSCFPSSTSRPLTIAPTGLITSWHTREQRRAARSSGVSEAIIEGLILVWYRGLGGDGTEFARTEVIRSLSTRFAPRLRRRPRRVRWAFERVPPARIQNSLQRSDRFASQAQSALTGADRLPLPFKAVD